ncbi:MAG: hypothetical protein DRH11_08550 [Deltaproteobacteria bacterium]|nr:MAG: hypothetical protein DRH11_08550 [Deltaproteobacteria bacterium]
MRLIKDSAISKSPLLNNFPKAKSCYQGQTHTKGPWLARNQKWLDFERKSGGLGKPRFTIAYLREHYGRRKSFVKLKAISLTKSRKIRFQKYNS